ncbi:LysR substrate-binding domain-containing protein [Saccharothrix sp. ST-888]|uniref:LysR substrate-binding domain-containing protein n=1 Tax=Saccharothrix sp. ST-888 TaxID=1427391 RepID=UPI001E627D8B|nr:LysR substrate-binding domain-containing protein [Saccharothrix sp. ST-888]
MRARILPPVLTRLATVSRHLTVTTWEGTTPVLIRALRAGSIDVAVLTSRPPHRPSDGESPQLHIETVEDTELLVGAATTGLFAGRTAVHVDELVDAPWTAAPSSSAEPLLGVWPGLPGRPRIVHTTSDWLTKLQLVAGGFGVTTVPSRMSTVLPHGVSLLRVDGAPPRSAGFSWYGFPADRAPESRLSSERSPWSLDPSPEPATAVPIVFRGPTRGRRPAASGPVRCWDCRVGVPSGPRCVTLGGLPDRQWHPSPSPGGRRRAGGPGGGRRGRGRLGALRGRSGPL